MVIRTSRVREQREKKVNHYESGRKKEEQKRFVSLLSPGIRPKSFLAS